MSETATDQVLVTYRVALPTGRVLRWDGMNSVPPVMTVPESNPREVAEFTSEAAANRAIMRYARSLQVANLMYVDRIEWTDKGEAWGAAVRAKNTAQAAAILTAESWPAWLGGSK